jgi:hypothetical protein
MSRIHEDCQDKHVRDRQGQWYKKLRSGSQEDVNAVRSPEQIIRCEVKVIMQALGVQ